MTDRERNERRARRQQQEESGTRSERRVADGERAPRKRRPAESSQSVSGERAPRKRRPAEDGQGVSGERAPRKRRPVEGNNTSDGRAVDRRNPENRRVSEERKAANRASVDRGRRKVQPITTEDDELFMMSGDSAKSQYTRNGNKRRGKRNSKIDTKNEKSKKIGIGLCVAQLIMSFIFIIAMINLNMLPFKYLALLVFVLILIFALLLVGQLYSKKNAKAGKAACIVMILILAVGSYFVFKTSATISSISGDGIKVDNMVVAVLADDPAESIEDAMDYSFGAQYAIGGDDVETAIAEIEEELGAVLTVSSYDDMSALAVALQSGEVQAIVYNESYAGVIEDENPDYATDIKIIYSHEIERELSLEDQEIANISVEDETFTVYISGIDVYGSITTNSRSDVNIIAQINPTTNEILLINTPRDYYVEFPGVTNGASDKLTHAGIYGVDTSIETLEALYDIDIDFYARVNFTSLIEMVDALGGISVYSEYSFTSTLHAGLYSIYVQKGYNDFNGTEALIFARERLNVPGGDDQRGKNQQQVIISMIDKATSPAIITGANSLLDSVSGNVDTNMTDDQIQTLIKTQIDTGAEWNIETISATGTGSSAYCYSTSSSTSYVTIPDQDSIDAIKEAIADNIAGVTSSDDDTEEETEE